MEIWSLFDPSSAFYPCQLFVGRLKMSILRHIQEKDLTLHISDGNMHVKHFFSCLFTSYSSSQEEFVIL